MYPVDGKPDDRHAILPPRQSVRAWVTVGMLLTGCTILLAIAGRWVEAPRIYSILFGAAALLTAVMGLTRWAGQNKPRLWLDGDMLEYRQLNGSTVLFNLLTFGGAYVGIDRRGSQMPRVYLDFRTDQEEAHYVETGFDPEFRPLGYLNRVPMEGVSGSDSMRAQFFADEINRRRGLVYKWRTG